MHTSPSDLVGTSRSADALIWGCETARLSYLRRMCLEENTFALSYERVRDRYVQAHKIIAFERLLAKLVSINKSPATDVTKHTDEKSRDFAGGGGNEDH